MLEQFLSANLATGATAVAIGAGATELELTVGAGDLFPSPVPDQYFVVTLSNATGTINEIVKVTARSGDVLTVVRAQEGTTALAWPAGSIAGQKWTEAQAQAVVQWTLLRPTVDVEFENGDPEVQIDLSDYDYLPSGILVKMSATEAKTLIDITGLSESVALILYVDEDSESISIELDTPPFFLSNQSGPYGWPGYPRTTISLLKIPGNTDYTWIETSRTWRTS